MKKSGQILLEFNLGLMILVPLLTGALIWYHTSWSRSKCAQETFTRARAKLIQTQSPVHLIQTCSSVHETVDLVPLENLDDGGTGLGVMDLVSEASRLLEEVSQFVSSSSPSDSSS